MGNVLAPCAPGGCERGVCALFHNPCLGRKEPGATVDSGASKTYKDTSSEKAAVLKKVTPKDEITLREGEQIERINIMARKIQGMT